MAGSLGCISSWKVLGLLLDERQLYQVNYTSDFHGLGEAKLNGALEMLSIPMMMFFCLEVSERSRFDHLGIGETHLQGHNEPKYTRKDESSSWEGVEDGVAWRDYQNQKERLEERCAFLV